MTYKRTFKSLNKTTRKQMLTLTYIVRILQKAFFRDASQIMIIDLLIYLFIGFSVASTPSPTSTNIGIFACMGRTWLEDRKIYSSTTGALPIIIDSKLIIRQHETGRHLVLVSPWSAFSCFNSLLSLKLESENVYLQFFNSS